MDLRRLILVVVANMGCAQTIGRSGKADLVSRPCPSEAAVIAAAQADSSLGRDVFPRRTYVTYLLNGRVVAANVPQDSLWSAGGTFGISALDTVSTGSITEIRIYKPHEVPPAIGICPGVTAIDVKTRQSP